MIENDEVFRESVRKLLREGAAEVTFTKADGSERVMKCTLNFEHIPTDYHPKKDSEPRKVNDETCRAFDVEAEGWRSFRWDAVKNVLSV